MDRLDKGRTASACAEIGAFIVEVQALLERGQLTPIQAQTLTDAAERSRVSLGCQ